MVDRASTHGDEPAATQAASLVSRRDISSVGTTGVTVQVTDRLTEHSQVLSNMFMQLRSDMTESALGFHEALQKTVKKNLHLADENTQMKKKLRDLTTDNVRLWDAVLFLKSTGECQEQIAANKYTQVDMNTEVDDRGELLLYKGAPRCNLANVDGKGDVENESQHAMKRHIQIEGYIRELFVKHGSYSKHVIKESMANQRTVTIKRLVEALKRRGVDRKEVLTVTKKLCCYVRAKYTTDGRRRLYLDGVYNSFLYGRHTKLDNFRPHQ